MKTLSAPPSLLKLYAKAAVTGPLHRGETLPDSVYQLSPQSIDASHLADYDRVCGFRYSDVLPPTYLHVLAFPLQIALMSENSFPFPVVGLVHVGNEIVVHRPVTVSDRVAFTVRAADLRPHPAGRQLDLLSEASVAGEIVWSGRSTYLRRGPKPAGETASPKPKHPAATSLGSVSQGSVSQVRVPGDIGRRYGAVSGDRNPIHMSGLSAKAFGFPSAIAHGMWLKARTLAALEGRLPDAFTVTVAFKTPLLIPSTIQIAVARGDSSAERGAASGMAGEQGEIWTLDVRNARSGKPHLTGTVTPALT